MHKITLSGLIGSQLDISLARVQFELGSAPSGQPITIQLNSDGGEVGEACAIANVLRTHPGGVAVEVIGWALSAATLLLMAGRQRRAHDTALLMVHAPWSSGGGNANDHRGQAELLDSIAQTMRTAYAATGQPARVIEGWLDGSDHWFTADEALAAGLVTEIITATAQAAAPANVYACRHPIPEQFRKVINMPNPNPTGAQPDAATIRAEAIRAEHARLGLIREHFSRVADQAHLATELRQLQAQCEADPNCTPEMAGLRILPILGRGLTPTAGGAFTGVDGGHRDNRPAEYLAAATDALLMRAGIRIKDPHPAARDLRSASLATMAANMLSMRGVSTRDLQPAGIAAKALAMSGGLSTSDFPSLLANTANKALRTAYQTAPATFREWSHERDVANFKPMTLTQLSEAPALEVVPELGEYKVGALTDSASTFQVLTRGKILSISRQAIINDDISAFTSLPSAWGNSALRAEADLVYGILSGNPVLNDGFTLFSTQHGNLAPAGGAPSLQNLSEARAAMRKQKDIAGLQFLDPMPRFMIVPVELETTSEQLLNGIYDPQANYKLAPNMEWVRNLTLVSDPRLTGTAWYLACDPQQLETILRVYLAGQDRPYIEEDWEFARDAMSMKCRLDVGAGVVDFRGLYKNPGA